MPVGSYRQQVSVRGKAFIYLRKDVAHAVAGGRAARAQHAQQAQHLRTHHWDR